MEKYQNLAEFQKEMHQFFEDYKKKLGLNPAWRITIEEKQIRGTYGEVEWDYPKRRFWIYINPKMNKDSKELRDSIIHELLHVFLMPYTQRAEGMLQYLPGDKQVKMNKTLDRVEDILVKKLTTIILGLDIKGERCEKSVRRTRR
jgi:hypothetical protein